jgi:hypothetical protein
MFPIDFITRVKDVPQSCNHSEVKAERIIDGDRHTPRATLETTHSLAHSWDADL